MIGIDAGLGFRTTSNSITEHQFVRANPSYEGDVTYDTPSQTGFLVHAGVPLALKSEKYFTFEAIPELNVGFASGTFKHQATTISAPGATAATYPNDISLSGMRLDIGARIGGEIHFGFIDIQGQGQRRNWQSRSSRYVLREQDDFDWHQCCWRSLGHFHEQR
jgi:hypothetical protein